MLALGAACSSSGDRAREAPVEGPIVRTDSDRHWVSQPQTSGGRFDPDVRISGPAKKRLGQDFVTPCRLDRSPLDVLAPNPPPVVAVSGTIHAWVDAGDMHGADSTG